MRILTAIIFALILASPGTVWADDAYAQEKYCRVLGSIAKKAQINVEMDVGPKETKLQVYNYFTDKGASKKLAMYFANKARTFWSTYYEYGPGDAGRAAYELCMAGEYGNMG